MRSLGRGCLYNSSMADQELPQEVIAHCEACFNDQIRRDEERERNYLTYEEFKAALEEALSTKFKYDNVFFKLVSELENPEPNRMTFSDFLTIYSK